MELKLLFRDLCKGLDKNHWQGTIYIIENNESLSVIDDYKGTKHITSSKAKINNTNTYLLYQHHFVDNYEFIIDEHTFKSYLFIKLYTNSNFTTNRNITFEQAINKVDTKKIHTLRFITHNDETDMENDISFNNKTFDKLFAIVKLCPIMSTITEINKTGIISFVSIP